MLYLADRMLEAGTENMVSKKQKILVFLRSSAHLVPLLKHCAKKPQQSNCGIFLSGLQDC